MTTTDDALPRSSRQAQKQKNQKLAKDVDQLLAAIQGSLPVKEASADAQVAATVRRKLRILRTGKAPETPEKAEKPQETAPAEAAKTVPYYLDEDPDGVHDPELEAYEAMTQENVQLREQMLREFMRPARTPNKLPRSRQPVRVLKTSDDLRAAVRQQAKPADRKEQAEKRDKKFSAEAGVYLEDACYAQPNISAFVLVAYCSYLVTSTIDWLTWPVFVVFWLLGSGFSWLVRTIWSGLVTAYRNSVGMSYAGLQAEARAREMLLVPRKVRRRIVVVHKPADTPES